MILPIFLIFVAIVAAGVVAYGMLPVWGQYSFGLDLIVFVRHFQWPLAALSLVACLALLGLIVSGKRRAWWLIGLAPVLSLLVHHLYSDPLRGFAVFDEPKFVAADAATGLKDDDWVLGAVLGGQSFAYPYGCIYSTPILIHTEHDKRMLLIWNPFADYPTARLMTHELHARDLSLVSMPGNAVIVFNKKHGQFINGITGATVGGEKPLGFGQTVEISKLTWKEWKALHPKTQVMQPPPNAVAGTPNRPTPPYFPIPPQSVFASVRPASTRIALVATTRPVAVMSENLTERPINIGSPDMLVVMFKDPTTHHAVAFGRRLEDGHEDGLHFVPVRRARAGVFMVDKESKSGWSIDGKAVEGTFAKEERKLVPVHVVEGCNWGVMKEWMPDLQIVDPNLQVTPDN
ncbi:MAG: DUF3179 domain-containing (seleno)protein [Tepidisphaerales bacterium]